MRLSRLPLTIAALAAVGVSAGLRGEEVVSLPPFQVRDTRPWTYAEIPGYQVLSLADSRGTQAFLARLQELQALTPLLLPLGTELRLTARSTLYVMHPSGSQILADASSGRQRVYRAYGIQLADSSIKFPSQETAQRWLRGQEYFCLDFIRVAAVTTPHLPIWYVDGMHVLLDSAQPASRGITIPARRFDTGTRMSLPELFAAASRRQVEGDERYKLAASEFVHWAFFSDNGTHRKALLEYVGAAARGPVDEAFFTRIFGMDYASAETVLAGYAKNRTTAAVLGYSAADPRSPKVVVRPATKAEVARIVGESYMSLGSTLYPGERATYLQMARTILEDARDSGSNDPEMLAQLGFLEEKSGNDPAAAAYLRDAVAANVQRPSAYVALARIQIRMANQRVTDPLSQDDAAGLLALLQKADSMNPRISSAGSMTAYLRNRFGIAAPLVDRPAPGIESVIDLLGL